MSVVAALGDLKKYAKCKPRADVSNTVFRLHRLTAAVLIGCSILTTSRQFFGEPIHCMLGGGSIPLQVFQSYCFMSGTYTLPHITSNITSAHPGVNTGSLRAGGAEDGTVYHNYYQWVCLLLVVQACVCYLPWGTWKMVEGGMVGKLLAKVSQDPLTETPLSDQVAGLGDFLLSHSGWFNSCALKLLLCQTSCLILTVGQMYAMDLALGNQFLSLGSNLLSVELLDKSLTKVFPKVVKCSMVYFGPSGDPVNNSGMCTLPINIINEKIYLVMWIWFMVLTLVTILCLLHQSLLLLLPSLRQIHIQRRSRVTPDHLVRSVSNRSTYGDTVLLQLIASNTDSAQFTALLVHLSDSQTLPHQQSFLHESYLREDKGLLTGKGARKEV
eukprot:GFUD01034182.1.p1 GENE.GFUD01034182.1~~GFUD01034182.1.p1  ORF type:complete len:384 (-),score=61.83 GFUD01034182.1:368-1519(-)